MKKTIFTLAFAALALAGSAFAQTCNFVSYGEGETNPRLLTSALSLPATPAGQNPLFGFAVNDIATSASASITFHKDGGNPFTQQIIPGNTAARRLPSGDINGNWTWTLSSTSCPSVLVRRFNIANGFITPLGDGGTTPVVTPPPPTGNLAACTGVISMGAKDDKNKPVMPNNAPLINTTFQAASPDFGVKLGGGIDTLAGVIFEVENVLKNIKMEVTKSRNEAGQAITPRVTGSWTIRPKVIEGCPTFSVPTVPFTVTDENTPIPSQTLGTVTVIGGAEVAQGGTLNLFFNGPNFNSQTLTLRITLNRLGAAPLVSSLEVFGVGGNPGRFIAPIATNALIGTWTAVVIDSNGNPVSFPFFFTIFTPFVTPPPVGTSQCSVVMDAKGGGIDTTLTSGAGFVPVAQTGAEVKLGVRSAIGRPLTPGGISNVIVGSGARDTDGTGVTPAPFFASGPGLHEVYTYFDIQGCGQVRARFRLMFADLPLTQPTVIPDPGNVYEVGRPLRFRIVSSSPISAWIGSARGVDQATDQVVEELVNGVKAFVSIVDFTPITDGDFSLAVHQEASGRFLPIAFFSVRRPQ